MMLGKYSMGIGDRFGRQGEAQLQAFVEARRRGIEVVPVWNKSNREHTIIHSEPAAVRAEADAAIAALGWAGPYHVDADHIGLATVERFLPSSDFFTIDVADFIGRGAAPEAIDDFVARHPELTGELEIARLDAPLALDAEGVRAIAHKFLLACAEAGRIHRHIAAAKGDACVIEVSMDETDQPQTPAELLVILAALADAGVPAQTIAPKFTGRFNKGVDYVGDVARFTREFEQDLAVIAHAVRVYDLPANLKLSVHSGSDKFSLYEPIRRALSRFDAGLHLKTAGTTWLEELIGLADSGGAGLRVAREVYVRALARYDELCAPYATMIDIDRAALPSVEAVARWSGAQFAAALRHDPTAPEYNPSFRQLLHVGYKVAAEMGDPFREALDANARVIGDGVRINILERHLMKVFG